MKAKNNYQLVGLRTKKNHVNAYKMTSLEGNIPELLSCGELSIRRSKGVRPNEGNGISVKQFYVSPRPSLEN
jgi:hypothetical protein